MQVKTKMKYHCAPLLEWPKSRRLTIPQAVRMWSNSHSHLWLVGMQNGTASLEYSLAASYKTKYPIIIGFNNCAPWYLLKEVENLFPDKNLHMDV